ncbi:MAG: TolC family protein [Sulfurospirillaceae bacterium]|nr:TolC family protein [Sulfurospirillaceae bacterium]
MKKIALFLALNVFVFGGNLDKLVELAQQNQAVQASLYSLEATKQKEQSTKSAYLPHVSIGASYANNAKETPSTPNDTLAGQAKISYILYDGGKREALYEQNSALIKKAQYEVQGIQNDVALQTVQYYYEWLAQNEAKIAKEQEMEQLLAEKYRLEKYLSVGSATNDEVQKIISQIAQSKVALMSIELAMSNALYMLEHLSGKEVSVENGSTIKVFEKAKEDGARLDILSQEEAVKSASFNAKSAKSSLYPTFAIENIYSRFENGYDNKMYDTGYDNQNTLQLSMSWKIFDFGSTNASYESAQKEYLSAKTNLDYAKSRAKVALRLAQKELEIATSKIDAQKARLEASLATYELVKKKFQNGIVNNVAYLDALSDRYDAQAQLKTALFDFEYKKAVAFYQAGVEIKGVVQ